MNRLLGGANAVLAHLKQFSKEWPGQTLIRILDIGAGGCDIPHAIIQWARKNEHRIEITCLDISEQALAFSKKQNRDFPEIKLVHADVFNLPFEIKTFDYVISSMFFHHLTDDEIVQVLKVSGLMAKRGIIINDLLRRKRAWAWIKLFSRFTSNRPFRNDGPLSVLRGFKKSEFERLIEKSGVVYLKYYEHFGHRFAAAGEK